MPVRPNSRLCTGARGAARPPHWRGPSSSCRGLRADRPGAAVAAEGAAVLLWGVLRRVLGAVQLCRVVAVGLSHAEEEGGHDAGAESCTDTQRGSGRGDCGAVRPLSALRLPQVCYAHRG